MAASKKPAAPKPPADDDGTEVVIPTPRDRALVGDVHVEKPADENGQGGGVVEFKAGTPASAMPAWALDAIGNPHAWDDSQRDERVEFIICPRLLAHGAPQAMVDEFTSMLADVRNSKPDEYEAAVAEMLDVTNDPIKVSEGIASYRQHTIERGGETYVEYLERAAQLGATPVSFDTFLASETGVIAEAPEADPHGMRGGESYEQYVERARLSVPPFEPVDLEAFLASPADQAVSPTRTDAPDPAAVAAGEQAHVADTAAQGGSEGSGAALDVTHGDGTPDVALKVN